MTKEEIDKLLAGVEMPKPAYVRTQGDIADIYLTDYYTADQLRETVAAAVAREREACAKEFDDRNNGIGFYDPHEPAEIIRARSKA